MIKFERLPSGILLRIPDLKKALGEDNNIIFAYIFGGLAKGKIGPLSDIDIAVYLGSTENLAENKIQIFDRLTDVLGTDELDIVFLNVASISIIGRVLQNKQVLVDKNPAARHAFESLALRQFFDFKIKEETVFSLRYGIGR